MRFYLKVLHHHQNIQAHHQLYHAPNVLSEHRMSWVNNDKCLKTYDEINLISKNGEAVQQPGIFASDYDLLMAIQDSHRVFYHVDKIVACLSGDR